MTFPVYELNWHEKVVIDERTDTWLIALALAVFGASLTSLLRLLVRLADNKWPGVSNDIDDCFSHESAKQRWARRWPFIVPYLVLAAGAKRPCLRQCLEPRRWCMLFGQLAHTSYLITN